MNRITRSEFYARQKLPSTAHEEGYSTQSSEYFDREEAWSELQLSSVVKSLELRRLPFGVSNK
jgi:hypothetical protein